MGKRIMYDNGFQDFESDIEADKHIASIPEGYPYRVEDITIEVEAKKALEAKKKNFSFKGTTIATLRQELNEWLEMNR